jgi:hypothetical protein
VTALRGPISTDSGSAVSEPGCAHRPRTRQTTTRGRATASITEEAIAMTDFLDPALLNFVYAFMGGVLTLMFMWFGCKLFGHIVAFDVQAELARGNQAVGMMIMGIFIGIGIAMGLVVGLGLN